MVFRCIHLVLWAIYMVHKIWSLGSSPTPKFGELLDIIKSVNIATPKLFILYSCVMRHHIVYMIWPYRMVPSPLKQKVPQHLKIRSDTHPKPYKYYCLCVKGHKCYIVNGPRDGSHPPLNISAQISWKQFRSPPMNNTQSCSLGHVISPNIQ